MMNNFAIAVSMGSPICVRSTRFVEAFIFTLLRPPSLVQGNHRSERYLDPDYIFRNWQSPISAAHDLALARPPTSASMRWAGCRMSCAAAGPYGHYLLAGLVLGLRAQPRTSICACRRHADRLARPPAPRPPTLCRCGPPNLCSCGTGRRRVRCALASRGSFHAARPPIEIDQRTVARTEGPMRRNCR